MNKLNFSENELNLIKYYAVKQPLSKSIVFFLCVLTAPIGFAIYGVFNKDSVALFVAFIGLLFFVVWYLFSSLKNEQHINNIFNKILKNELSE